jgi:hypothetical protein
MPDRKQVTEELENLQLDEARYAAQQRSQVRIERANKAKAIELSLKRDRYNQKRIQSACQHRKGGKGTGQMYSGNDPNYAVIIHTLSHGPTIVVCQRCGNVWEPPLPLTRNATPEQRNQYKVDLTEYRRALNFPTDNEPSGTTLFAFTTFDEDAA